MSPPSFSFFPRLLTQLRPSGGWWFVFIPILGSRGVLSLNFITCSSWEFGYAIDLLFLCADLEKSQILSSTTASIFFFSSRILRLLSGVRLFTMALCLCNWASVDGEEMGASNVLFMYTRLCLFRVMAASIAIYLWGCTLKVQCCDQKCFSHGKFFIWVCGMGTVCRMSLLPRVFLSLRVTTRLLITPGQVSLSATFFFPYWNPRLFSSRKRKWVFSCL